MQHILSIEDDPHVQKLVAIFLASKGYKVIIANTGANGLSILKKTDIDLVLLDIILPDMTGLEVLNHIKQIKPALPVIMLTGLIQEEVWKKAMQAGAVDYITKPFNSEQLYMNVRTHLVSEKHEG